MKIERKTAIEKIQVVDAQGARHEVIVFSPFIEIPPSSYPFKSGRDHIKKSTVRIELSDKRPINRIDDDTFEIVVTGGILKRVK